MNQIVFTSMRFVVTAQMDENDPYAYIKEVYSELLCYAYDDMEDADDESVVAGKLSFCIVDVYGAQQFGISLSELFCLTAWKSCPLSARDELVWRRWLER